MNGASVKALDSVVVEQKKRIYRANRTQKTALFPLYLYYKKYKPCGESRANVSTVVLCGVSARSKSDKKKFDYLTLKLDKKKPFML